MSDQKAYYRGVSGELATITITDLNGCFWFDAMTPLKATGKHYKLEGQEDKSAELYTAPGGLELLIPDTKSGRIRGY